MWGTVWVFVVVTLTSRPFGVATAFASSALDIIAECHEEWAHEIRHKQFEFHNAVWLQKVLDGGQQVRRTRGPCRRLVRGQAERHSTHFRLHRAAPRAFGRGVLRRR